MKKNIYFGILLAIFTITLLSWNSGTPGGKTGSPIDVNTCTQCHGGTASQQDGWITSNIPATGYMPGETYTITATGTHTGASKFGFEITSENNDAKVGTFIVTDGTTTKLDNVDKAITHTSSNAATDGSKTWSFEWTAPATGTGDVTFYGAFNAADGNGGTSGDVIYTSELAVSESTVNIEDNTTIGLSVFPNPAKDYLNINSKNTIKNIRIIDISGKEFINISGINSKSEKIDLDIFSEGIYFIKIEGNDFTKVEKIIIKK